MKIEPTLIIPLLIVTLTMAMLTAPKVMMAMRETTVIKTTKMQVERIGIGMNDKVSE